MAEIHLFEHEEFGGRRLILRGDDTDIHNNNPSLGDKVSSVRVTSGTFTIFEDKNFGGYSFTVARTGGPSNNGDYPHSRFLADRNDKISSVRKNSDEPA